MGGTNKRGIVEYEIQYSPLPSQRKFHDAEAAFKGFSGPVGSGKSQALCQEAVRQACRNPGRTGLIGAPTYPMVRDATLPSLIEIIEAAGLKYAHNKAENILYLTEAKSRILLRSLDEFERLRGTNLAWFGIDELTYVHEEAWLRLVARLRDGKAARKCGFAVWTPRGFDWVYDRFVTRKLKDHAVILAEPFENRHVLKSTPDYYERLKESYSESFYAQEVLGQYLALGTETVYREFSRGRNVEESVVDEGLPLLWALDFNIDPMCSVVAQIQDGRVRVIDEIVLRRVTTDQACEAFWEKYGSHPAGVVVYGDASGNADRTTGQSDKKMIREFFRTRAVDVDYRVPKKNPPVRDRVNVLNQKFRTDLVVSAKCEELIKDFEQVSYKERSTVIDKDRDRRRTHLSDALGYLVWQENANGPFGHVGKPLW